MFRMYYFIMVSTERMG